MNDRYFLDTNIFIYTFDVRSPEKQRIAKHLISEGLDHNHSCVSWQVIDPFQKE
jgi:predicted nucleic acid-binding protein